MRKYLLVFLLPLAFACEEKDKSVDNPAPNPENVFIGASFVYGDEGIKKDSVIINDLGYNFFIDEVKIVCSDFFMTDVSAGNDTIVTDSSAFVISMEEPQQDMVVLTPGGYSVRYGMRLGLDSLHGALMTQQQAEAGSDMDDPDLYRSDMFGIDHVIIRGRLFDPTDPQDTVGKIPLEYRLGTYLTSKKLQSTQRNFSIERTSKLKLVLFVDLKPVLHQFDLFNKPTVTTDPSNQVDLLFAKQMSDSLKIGLF